MHFLILVLAACFFIFLYTLYFLANDDFIIIKKDMPMDKLFNTAFLTAFVALFFSRLFYVILYPQKIFFDILGFFLFPYFPGLSLLGAVLGGSVFLIFYARAQNLPVGRTFDFFTIAFLSALPVGFLGAFILAGDKYFLTFIFSFVVYLVFFFVFTKVILPSSFRGDIKSGSIGIIFLICFSVVEFLAKIISDFKNFSIISPENVILLALFVASALLFTKQEIMVRTNAKK